VVEYLAAVLEGQVRFLRERFGADFVRRTL